MQGTRAIGFFSKTSCRFPHSQSGHKVFIELSNTLYGSNTLWRGTFCTASVPSRSSKPRGGQKRLSKEERRAVIESFVDKYKTLNAGKYPGPDVLRKEVGGSYYVTKQILQELKFKSQKSSKDDSLLKKVAPKELQPLVRDEEIPRSTGTMDFQIKKLEYSSPKSVIDKDQIFFEEVVLVEECQAPSEVEEILSSKETLNMTHPDSKIINNMERNAATSKICEEKEVPLISCQESFSEKAANARTVGGGNSDTRDSFQMKSRTEVSHTYINEVQDNGSNGKILKKDLLELSKSDKQIMEEADQKPSSSDNFGRGISRKEKEEDPLPMESTVWGSLRSFADGIINLWRKM